MMTLATKKILRREQVQSLTGLSRSTLYAEIKKDRFPKQIKLTDGRSVGWLESEVQDHIQARIDASRNTTKGN